MNKIDLIKRINLTFIIRVLYDAEHNTITELRSFKHGHSLDKYSANVTIE